LKNIRNKKMKVEDAEKFMGLPEAYDRSLLDKTFRKLSLQMHPDKNRDDKDATANFQRLAECYKRLQRQLAGHGGDDSSSDESSGSDGGSDDDGAAGGGGGASRKGRGGGGMPSARNVPYPDGMSEREFFEFLYKMGAFGGDDATCDCSECRAARRAQTMSQVDDHERQKAAHERQKAAREAARRRWQEEAAETVAEEARLEPLVRAAKAKYADLGVLALQAEVKKRRERSGGGSGGGGLKLNKGSGGMGRAKLVDMLARDDVARSENGGVGEEARSASTAAAASSSSPPKQQRSEEEQAKAAAAQAEKKKAAAAERKRLQKVTSTKRN
jgi:curved DNA-binding protein CbpA